MTLRLKIHAAEHTKGSALVEFSLVVVMFVMVLVGVVELVRMVLVSTTIANAARAGARYASVHGHGRAGGTGADGESGPGNNPAQVITVVKGVARAGLVTLGDSNITVTYSPSNAAGSTVTVKVVYTFDSLVPYFKTLLNARLGSTSQGVITF
jgi:Flp pilus assembly protein TadG